MRGDVEFEQAGRSYPFRPDTVFVSRPNEMHRLMNNPYGISQYWLLFRIPKENSRMLGFPLDEARWLCREMMALPRSFKDVDHRIRAAFQRLFYLYDTAPRNTPERRNLIRNAVHSLFVAIVETSKSSERILPTARLARIVEEIRKEPGKAYPVDELARRAALSPTGLLQRFKHLTGLPPHAFVLSCRIERAKRELSADEDSIAVIASRLGFPSAQHFATRFRRIVGMTPSEWRVRKNADV